MAAGGAGGRRALTAPFPLENGSSLCYLNSLLQVLSAIIRYVGVDGTIAEHMGLTKTGRALRLFFGADAPEPSSSKQVFDALMTDLIERSPSVLEYFGAGQQSCLETLLLMLEMLNVVQTPSVGASDEACELYQMLLEISWSENPVANLFKSTVRESTLCAACGLNNPKMQEMTIFPRGAGSSKTFVENLVPTKDDTERLCRLCLQTAGAVCVREIETLARIVCVVRAKGANEECPTGFDHGRLKYRLVGTVDHSGDSTGGHYWASALKLNASGGEQAYVMDDMSCREMTTGLVVGPATYMALYCAE